ncbi:MAG: hypothetical protein GBAus27B_000095 [Mycoplasmataceae bacterium]|nr:MAG: hypothetical protein GBAus27B_000095 [Mycoplasmataceae bacterium]
MEFQKLLEIIKKYKNGSDYIHSVKTKGKCSPDNYRSYCVSWDNYTIYSSELKKEARNFMLEGSVEDGGFQRRGGREADWTIF